MREMYESLGIIFQILTTFSNLKFKNLEINNINFLTHLAKTNISHCEYDTKYSSMEALINHFKNYSEGMRVPRGFTYQAVEAPKGEFGVSLIADGTSNPYRCKIRTPAYHHIQIMPRLVQGH